MDLREKEELIRLVTEQVLGALTSADVPQEEGKRKILVVGKLCRVSETAARGAVLLPLEDYQQHQNILRYDGVHITRLTLTELADTALGRTDSPAACAVVHALLENLPVTMEETALPHRAYAGKQRAGLYHLYESYVQTLQVFGVKLLSPRQLPEEKPARPARFQPPAPAPWVAHGVKNPDRVITEALALSLCTGPEVCLPAGTIITPAARDVFAQKGVRVVTEP